jgi:hypothetical protein
MELHETPTIIPKTTGKHTETRECPPETVGPHPETQEPPPETASPHPETQVSSSETDAPYLETQQPQPRQLHTGKVTLFHQLLIRHFFINLYF